MTWEIQVGKFEINRNVSLGDYTSPQDYSMGKHSGRGRMSQPRKSHASLPFLKGLQIRARTSAYCPFVKKLYWNVRVHSRVACCCVCDPKAELRVEWLPSPSQTGLPAPPLDDKKFLVSSLSLKTRISSRT